MEKTLRAHQLYDWDTWFNGKIHVLVEGQHFKTTVQKMRATLVSRSVYRNIQVRTMITKFHDKHILIVQAVGKRYGG